MAKQKSYLDIGFNKFLTRDDPDERIKINKAIEEQEIRALQKLKLEKELELLNKGVLPTPTETEENKEGIKSLNPNILQWESFYLDLETGQASILDKSHRFQPNQPAYLYFKLLMEKRLSGKDEGNVTYEEFTLASGVSDKEKIKSTIRQIRRHLKINRRINKLKDIFLDTGTGYKLILPSLLV